MVLLVQWDFIRTCNSTERDYILLHWLNPLAKEALNVDVIVIGKKSRLTWGNEEPFLTAREHKRVEDVNQNKEASRSHHLRLVSSSSSCPAPSLVLNANQQTRTDEQGKCQVKL